MPSLPDIPAVMKWRFGHDNKRGKCLTKVAALQYEAATLLKVVENQRYVKCAATFLQNKRQVLPNIFCISPSQKASVPILFCNFARSSPLHIVKQKESGGYEKT